jgi:glycosyltransferase involved in cell wall biosynthesis
MKVLFVNESDYSGGAARAMFRTNEALLDAGVDVKLLVKYKTIPSPQIIECRQSKNEKFMGRIDSCMLSYLNRVSDPDKAAFYYKSRHNQLPKIIKSVNPDILHLHWFSNVFMNLKYLQTMSIPVVWTFHDMRAFTGGCAYTEGCSNYFTSCGNCPILVSGRAKDKSSDSFKLKQKIYKSFASFTVIAPSNWMKNEALKSPLMAESRIMNIPYCIDTEKYKPGNKEWARSILNLPMNKKLILFGAAGGIADKRKGFAYALEAFNKLKEDDYMFVVFGEKESSFAENGGKIHNAGKISDEQTLSLLYSASDVMLVPSIQENLANTILESLSCGTPVAAFNIGGNRDMIEHKINGYLASPFSSDDLTEGIKFLTYSKEMHMTYSMNARKKIEETFNYKAIAGRHIDLYNEILNQR